VEASNKGGVRGEGTVGRLLTMAWETDGGPVRHDGARRTAALSWLDGGRETRAGPAHQQGRRGEDRVVWFWEEGRCAAVGSKTGDGPKLKKKFLLNFI
jgi:hypothetical protein